MINKQWMREGVGACGVASIVLGASLAFAPAANAVTPTLPGLPTNDVVGGVLTTTGGIVNGVLTPQPGATSPVTIGTDANGSLNVGVNGTTVSVGTGTNGGAGVGVTGTGGSAIGVNLGFSPTGTTINGGTTTGTGGGGGPGGGGGTGGTGGGGTGGTGGSGGTGAGGGSSTGTDGMNGTGGSNGTGGASGSNGTDGSSSGGGAAIMLTALAAETQYQTVYPAKDGYRDTVAFQLQGTTTDGKQHAASGVAKLTFGSTLVQQWPITATDNRIVWNGLKGGKIVPGRYLFTAQIGDASGTFRAGTDSVDVSAKKLKAATATYSTKSVSGKHKMAAKPLSGLAKDKVTLKVISKVSGIKGKEYLVFTHGSKKIKFQIKNGTHTSRALTIPKSFTTYTTSHTWKKGVKIKSLKYKYTYKALK